MGCQLKVRSFKTGRAIDVHFSPCVCYSLLFHYLQETGCSFGEMIGVTNVGEIMLCSTARPEGQEKKQELGQVPGTLLRKERAHGSSRYQDHLGLAGALTHCPFRSRTKPKAYLLILFRSPCVSMERKASRPSPGGHST